MNELKILCILGKEQASRLADLLAAKNINHSIVESEPARLLMDHVMHHPDVIITDEVFWNTEGAIEQIQGIHQVSITPVIIWSAAIDEKIIAAVFNQQHLFYVRQSDEEKTLLETLAKLKSGIYS